MDLWRAKAYVVHRLHKGGANGAAHEVKADPADPAWGEASWSDDFVDIQGDDAKGPGAFGARTRVKMCYDDDFLYVLSELSSPSGFPVVATLTERNSVIYASDSDFEVFVDPRGSTHDYFELKVNALNTKWNLKMDKPYVNGGKEHSGRVAKPGEELYWDVERQQTATSVEGPLNSTEEKATWYCEAALAFADMEARPSALPWRANFSRVERGGDLNWVWSPQYVWKQGAYAGVCDMHRPEAWGYLIFDGFEEEETEEEVCFLKQAAMQVYSCWEDGYVPVDDLLEQELLPASFKQLKYTFTEEFPKWCLELKFPNCPNPIVTIRYDRLLTAVTT